MHFAVSWCHWRIDWNLGELLHKVLCHGIIVCCFCHSAHCLCKVDLLLHPYFKPQLNLNFTILQFKKKLCIYIFNIFIYFYFKKFKIHEIKYWSGLRLVCVVNCIMPMTTSTSANGRMWWVLLHWLVYSSRALDIFDGVLSWVYSQQLLLHSTCSPPLSSMAR